MISAHLFARSHYHIYLEIPMQCFLPVTMNYVIYCNYDPCLGVFMKELSAVFKCACLTSIMPACRMTPSVTWTPPSRWPRSSWTSQRCSTLKVRHQRPPHVSAESAQTHTDTLLCYTIHGSRWHKDKRSFLFEIQPSALKKLMHFKSL